jgi:hypothetical protein
VPSGADQERLEAIHQRLGRQRLERHFVATVPDPVWESGALSHDQQDRRGSLLAQVPIDAGYDVGGQIAVDDAELSRRCRCVDLVGQHRREAGALERIDVGIGLAAQGEQDGGSLHCPSLRWRVGVR